MSNLVKIKDCIIYSEFIDKKISETTIRRLIKAKTLKSEKENNITLIDKHSFIEYLNNKKENTKKQNNKIISNKINDELLISIDWFQVTFYARTKNYFSFSELKSIFTNLLHIKSTDITYHENGYNNYKKMLEYSGIFLMYGDETYNHCNLQLKGEGCRILYNILVKNKKNWYTFFEEINKLKGKITRMDIAIDDYSPIFELEEIQEKIEKKEIKTSFKNFQFLKDLNYTEKKTGMTIYLGSNKSDMFYRFYKKDVELENKNKNTQEKEQIKKFNRYEIVLKDKKANSTFKKIINEKNIEKIAISLISKNFNVYENEKLTKYWSKWEQLILGSHKFNFDIPKINKSVEKTKAWLKTCVSTSIQRVILADEEAKKNNLLDENYDTLQDILLHSKYKDDTQNKTLINEYINKKREVKEKMDT